MGNEKFPNVFIDRFLSNDFCHLYNQSRDPSGIVFGTPVRSGLLTVLGMD